MIAYDINRYTFEIYKAYKKHFFTEILFFNFSVILQV